MLEFHNNLGEEHVMLRDSMRKMVDREYPAEVARKIDEEDRYPREVMDKLAKMGITNLYCCGGMSVETSGASREQSQALDHVDKTVVEPDSVVQQNASNAEESASAAEQINAPADQMQCHV